MVASSNIEQLALPAGMRSQSLACSVVDTSPFAPRCGFYPASDRCARARLPFLPARSHCLGTAFPLLSLTRNDCSLSKTTAARSKFLAYSFGFNSEPVFQPVRS